MIHLHVIRTNFGIASDGDNTMTIIVVIQYIWHINSNSMFCCFCYSFSNLIPGHRCNLSTAIDALTNLGIALDDDRRIATHQSGVAMFFFTCASTINITLDFRSTFGCTCCHSFTKSNCHRRIPFHAAYLTATIDGAIYDAIADGDIRIAVGIIGI